MDTAARATDQRLAMAALEKQRRGDMPNREEMAALKRFERERDEETRQKHLRTIRRGEWCQWAGRKPKAVQEHAARHGLPLAGETIDVVALAPALHDLLDGLAARPESAEKPNGELTPLERKRLAEARRIEHQLQCELGRWIKRESVGQLLAGIGGRLRRAGELLSSRHGPAARKILDDALAECERQAGRLMSDEIGTSP